MKKSLLGNTDIWLSPLGLGTVKFGRNTQVKYPEHFTLPSDNTLKALLAQAQSLGVNVIDTAPAYGNSEERLGKLLKHQRNQWVIISKAGEFFDGKTSTYDFTPRHIRHSIETSLQRLHTDHIDILLIHSDGRDVDIIHDDDVFGTLAECQRQGLIRAFGMSTKTIEGTELTIHHSDVVMVTYNAQDKTMAPMLALAEKENKGMLIKKAFASGHHPSQEIVKEIYRFPAVSSIILGTINPAHLAENVNHANQALGAMGENA